MKAGAFTPVATGTALGIDLGGTRIKCAWLNAASAQIEGTRLIPTRDCPAPDGTPAFAQDIRTHVADLERELGRPFTAICIAAPGLASADQRSIACMPGRLAGLAALDWRVILQRSHAVPVINDAHAALLGEAWLGAARGVRHAVMLTLGTGVGGAIMADGRLLTGAFGRAGHLGHVSLDRRGPPDIVGTPGSLEDAIGECTLAQRSGQRFASTQSLVAAVAAGDPQATTVWLHSLDALAAALVSFINTLDPELIVIGGGIAQAGEALFAPLRRRMAEIEWRPLGRTVPIVPSELNDRAGACGAASAALDARFTSETHDAPP